MNIELDNPPEEVRIEIIPLIDVIFCILTFFILSALQLTRQQAINVNLPTATTGTSQMQEMLIVTVDDLGQTYVEKEPVTSQQLIGELQVYHQRNPQGLMLLYANRTAVYGDVIQILDLMRSIGGDRVALATLPTTSPNLSNLSSLVNPRNNLINPGSPFTPSNPNFDPNRSFIAPR
ncbi:MAG: ExbD/TolR family protein [Synechococcales cyanobacterium]